jgi:hypothetical protein
MNAGTRIIHCLRKQGKCNEIHSMGHCIDVLDVQHFCCPHFPSKYQYFPVPPNSCRTPQDSAGLQAKVLILVASPAKLGRTWQSLEGLDRIQTELCRIYFKLKYITKKQPVMIYLYADIHFFVFDCFIPYPTPLLGLLPSLYQFPF